MDSKETTIPFGAFDSELHYHEINIPDGCEATIKDGKIIIRKIESEDEKIMKALIKFHKSTIDIDGIKGNEILAWLEKQGEKPVIEMKLPEESLGISSKEYNEIVNECLYGEQKPADRVEPKFQNGQWIVWQNKCYKVNYNGCGYELIDQNGLRTSLEYGTVDKSAHLWTIQDAKDGDVLSYRDGQWIFIYEGKLDDNSFYYHTLYSIIHQGLTINDAGFTLLGDAIIPATKEQRDLLFAKMKEAGYEWLEETKELKKIEQKSAEWSEEDEKMYSRICYLIHAAAFENYDVDDVGKELGEYAKITDWLKAIKTRCAKSNYRRPLFRIIL